MSGAHVIFSMTVSLDGFIAGPDGSIDFSAPDEKLHRFHNARVAGVSLQLCGRRLYETMLPWEDQSFVATTGAPGQEFAAIWSQVPKVVFSRTLREAQGGFRLARGTVADELRRASGVVEVGGAELAAAAAQYDLIDEYQLFVAPVLLGGGTPYWPSLSTSLRLTLRETRRFNGGVVYLRYERGR